MNKRDFLTFLAVAPSAALPAVASELARNELNGWRPIETAPRDRPVLVLACKEVGCLAEFSQRIAVGKFYFEWFRGAPQEGNKIMEFVIYTSHHGEKPVDAVVAASHWMPLPEEPK